jgi:hypothetical protein
LRRRVLTDSHAITPQQTQLNGLRAWLRTLQARVDALPVRSFSFGNVRAVSCKHNVCTYPSFLTHTSQDYVIVAEPTNASHITPSGEGLMPTANNAAGLDY